MPTIGEELQCEPKQAGIAGSSLSLVGRCCCADAMPVEIVQFCWKYNLERLQRLPELAGAAAKLRMESADKPYVTDNSNYIVDLYFEDPIKDPHAGATYPFLYGCFAVLETLCSGRRGASPGHGPACAKLAHVGLVKQAGAHHGLWSSIC